MTCGDITSALSKLQELRTQPARPFPYPYVHIPRVARWSEPEVASRHRFIHPAGHGLLFVHWDGGGSCLLPTEGKKKVLGGLICQAQPRSWHKGRTTQLGWHHCCQVFCSASKLLHGGRQMSILDLRLLAHFWASLPAELESGGLVSFLIHSRGRAQHVRPSVCIPGGFIARKVHLCA